MNWTEIAEPKVKLIKSSEVFRQAQIDLITDPLTKSERSLWLAVYFYLTSKGELTKIEDMPPDEKKDFKKAVFEICQGKNLSPHRMADVARCLITIEFYL